MEGVGIVGHHGGRARLHEVGVHEVLLRVPQELFVRGLVGEGGDQLGGELGGHDSVQDGGDVLDWSPLDGGEGLGNGGRSFLDLRLQIESGSGKYLWLGGLLWNAARGLLRGGLES